MNQTSLQNVRERTDSRHSTVKQNLRQQLMLDVCKNDGVRLGLPYSYLVAVTLNLSATVDAKLELVFATHKLRLYGRNLHLLYERLLGHSLGMVREAERPDFDDAGPEESFVRRIEVEEVG